MNFKEFIAFCRKTICMTILKVTIFNSTFYLTSRLPQSQSQPIYITGIRNTFVMEQSNRMLQKQYFGTKHVKLCASSTRCWHLSKIYLEPKPIIRSKRRIYYIGPFLLQKSFINDQQSLGYQIFTKKSFRFGERKKNYVYICILSIIIFVSTMI